jgi:hypothetical protein
MLWIGTAAMLVIGIVALLVVIAAKKRHLKMDQLGSVSHRWIDEYRSQ